VGWLLGENITLGRTGFGFSTNEAMMELIKQMEIYHLNWEEYADPV